MDHQALYRRLAALRKGALCGLLSHVVRSEPYLTPEMLGAWAGMKSADLLAREHAGRLTSLMKDMGGGGGAAVYQIEVANYHFMALSSVVEGVIEQLQGQVEGYREAARLAGGDARYSVPLEGIAREAGACLDGLERAVSGVV